MTKDSQDSSRSNIIDAARAAFLSSGYARTTYRSIATAAGVAPTVISNMYKNKEALFAAALSLPFDPQGSILKLVSPGVEGMGERLVRGTLQLVSDEKVRTDLAKAAGAVTGSAPSVAGINVFGVIKPLSDYFQVEVVDRALLALGIPDARVRGSLISAYLSGIVAYRYFLKIEPLASMSEDQVVALVSPTIQQLLDPAMPLPAYTSEPVAE